MSGPKRADVEAQLSVARAGRRKCAKLISKAEDAAIASLLKSADAAGRQATNLGQEAQQILAGLTPDVERIAPDSIRDAHALASDVVRQVEESRSALQNARAAVGNSQQNEHAADSIYARANQALKEAEAALQRSGNHYLRNEMEQATAARISFDQAEAELAKARNARQEASRQANRALQRANEALATAQSARRNVQATRAEAEDRLRAEAEANRIEEEKLRNATLALEQSRAFYGRLQELPHDKFRPGEGETLRQSLVQAQRLLQQGRYDDSQKAAVNVQSQVRALEQEVMAAVREFERHRTEAASHISGLQATIEGIDALWIREWADTPEALDKALAILERAKGHLSTEDFEAATRLVQTEKDAVNQALQSAADNQSRHEIREKIGEAVMDVLEELNFDVTYGEGTRTTPLRIVGQTPEESGRGDFDISIPLDGEVDFQVNTPDGDTSCVAAVQALQKRLAERGVEWHTTNWGHAEGAQATAPASITKQKTTQTIKHKSR